MSYRFCDTKVIQVQHPFEFGLFYTTFVYNNLKMTKKSFKKDEKVKFTVDITDTGKVFGQEIVQIYVKDTESLLVRPEKELKAFKKVALKSGETKTIEFELEERAFAYYVPRLKDFIVESGQFELLISGSVGFANDYGHADWRCHRFYVNVWYARSSSG